MSVPLYLRLEEEEIAVIDALALAEKRSRASMLEILVLEALALRGRVAS